MAEWVVDDVANRFTEAARTARRLPPVRVQGYFSVWPAFVRTEYERLAGDDAPPLRFPPSPKEVDQMLEVMRWVQWLDVDQRKLVRFPNSRRTRSSRRSLIGSRRASIRRSRELRRSASRECCRRGQ